MPVNESAEATEDGSGPLETEPKVKAIDLTPSEPEADATELEQPTLVPDGGHEKRALPTSRNVGISVITLAVVIGAAGKFFGVDLMGWVALSIFVLGLTTWALAEEVTNSDK